MKFIRAAAVSTPVHLGDIEANEREILSVFHTFEEKGVHIALLPPLCLTGATLGDLLSRPAVAEAAMKALKRLAVHTSETAVVLGLPVEQRGCIVSAMAVLYGGEVRALVPQGEARVFDMGTFTFAIGGGEADVLLWPDAAPSVSGSHLRRCEALRQHDAVVYACAGMGESTTDHVFDGYTAIAERGTILAESERFASGMSMADIDVECLRYRRSQPLDEGQPLCSSARPAPLPLMRPIHPLPFVPQAPEALDEIALLQSVGLASRLQAIRCRDLVIGVSGGLDSTLALLIAVQAFDRLGLDRKGIHAITLPGMGTGKRTKTNADRLMEALGVSRLEIPIGPAVRQHFADIGQDEAAHDVTYENSQARERTQILMDYANKVGGIVLGTGDLSEAALGFCTYNGDHMSMYSVNASIPKTLVKQLVRHLGRRFGGVVGEICQDVADTPISPELLPVEEGELNQRTEDILGDYTLHDFYLYHFLDSGADREKLLVLAGQAFAGAYPAAKLESQLDTFLRRFRTQQFKRSCMPDGPQATPFSLSPRGAWKMPSDAAGMV